jgi:hypothetical protein
MTGSIVSSGLILQRQELKLGPFDEKGPHADPQQRWREIEEKEDPDMIALFLRAQLKIKELMGKTEESSEEWVCLSRVARQLASLFPEPEKPGGFTSKLEKF